MSCQWQAPCGCIIEFEGQLIDKGQTIKAHKAQCARHNRGSDHSAAADAAFDDCKFKERVRAYLTEEDTLTFTSPDFDLLYDTTGPIKLIIHRSLTNNQKTNLESRIIAKFGVGVVDVSYG